MAVAMVRERVSSGSVVLVEELAGAADGRAAARGCRQKQSNASIFSSSWLSDTDLLATGDWGRWLL